MSEQQISDRFPLSESFIITIVGALIGCVSGVLACVLKSRCSTIKCCGIECQRVPIPVAELDKVAVDMTPVNLRPRLNAGTSPHEGLKGLRRLANRTRWGLGITPQFNPL